MKQRIISVLFLFMVSFSVFAESENKTIEEPLFKPFIERYILDEIKSLRQENQRLKAEVKEQIVEAKLESSDRAIEYATSTINNIFYIITAAASLLVLLGWRSLSDIKKSIKLDTSRKIQLLTGAYEERLQQIEDKMKERSKVIIDTQQKISNTNTIHSLWMRAGLEKSDSDRITIYDDILILNPHDVEAMTYKADALLEIGEARWALDLTSAAIEIDDEYSLAYWQRACAYARMEKFSEAISDIETSLSLSETLSEELLEEPQFANLQELEAFKNLVNPSNVT